MRISRGWNGAGRGPRLRSRDGQHYRNRNGIQQWENLLAPAFLRIHRSFLVQSADAVLTATDLVTIGGQALPVSRKYKDSVKAALSATGAL